MAGDYIFGKSRKDVQKKIRDNIPRGAEVYISRASSLDKRAPKGQKAYYHIIDVKSKSGKLLWHN